MIVLEMVVLGSLVGCLGLDFGVRNSGPGSSEGMTDIRSTSVNGPVP